ncbi:hypothetical protein AGLY_016157 [Aphis glycines]|uniref:Uncharacterized protein n=1 Tax=Aphis glycines TaxID=307491 RepID=A0A6G0SZT0_APHGL|nr:hypothetical protein AGLY_016157 [Aphis glycines]
MGKWELEDYRYFQKYIPDDTELSDECVDFTMMCFALLLVMTCVVHYDLFSLFSNHPYGRRIVYTDNERHQRQPTFDFDYIRIPRPGTDSTTFYSPPQFIVHDHGTDGDDYWTESVDGTHSNRGTTGDKRSDNQVHRPTPDTEVDSVHETTTTEVPNVLDDDYDDDSDYVAPGQEWEDDVF